MDLNINKTNDLLKFYFKNGVKIRLRALDNNYLTVRGVITKMNFLFKKYVVIKHETRAPIKLFLEDIQPGSIIPTDYEKKENKNNRKGLPPKLRHKILKRDRNTCTACGARAPDVQLEVDHIIPVSKGGSDDPQNLTTLCRDCNRGKSDKQ